MNLLKPEGFTSHDAVLKVRHILKEPKIGHIGTLDPGATGVLPLLLGSYRKMAEYFQGEDKDYLAEFTFGVSTDTGDLQGQVMSEKDAKDLTPEKVNKVLPNYVGEIGQVPPKYSALKVGGEKLYRLARLGVDVDLPERKVSVYRFKLLSWKEGIHPKGLFSLTVGSGTYVRSLSTSIGEDLGCGASVSMLLRSRVGPFRLRDAVTLGAIERSSIQNRSLRVLADQSQALPKERLFSLKPDALHKVQHGSPLGLMDFLEPGKVRLFLRGETSCFLGKRPVKDEKRRSLPFRSERTGNPVFFGMVNESAFETVTGTISKKVSAPSKIVCVLSSIGKNGEPEIVYEKVLI